MERRFGVRTALVAATLAACGQGTLAADDACGPCPEAEVAAVTSISDDLDIALADGRTIRLAGIEAPLATAASPDLPDRARATLADWFRDGTLAVRALAAADRWNRVPAFLFRTRDGAGPASAGAALLRRGLARVRPESLVHACIADLLAEEATARGAHAGLWGDPAYAVLGADDDGGLRAQVGGMVLVEGTLHMHEARGTLYLSLGRDRWGFTAIVLRRDAERFAKAGLVLSDYADTPVRLRGDLDDRFGLRMAVTDPDQIESLEPGSSPAPSRPTAP